MKLGLKVSFFNLLYNVSRLKTYSTMIYLTFIAWNTPKFWLIIDSWSIVRPGRMKSKNTESLNRKRFCLGRYAIRLAWIFQLTHYYSCTCIFGLLHESSYTYSHGIDTFVLSKIRTLQGITIPRFDPSQLLSITSAQLLAINLVYYSYPWMKLEINPQCS